MERVAVRFGSPTPAMPSRDVGRSVEFYRDVLDFEFESRTIGRVPEFSCKYLDWTLPDECTTTWRNVVVEVPVPVKRHDYFEVDVLDGSWQDRQVTIDVPRLVWKEERLLVSLPALAVRAPPSP